MISISNTRGIPLIVSSHFWVTFLGRQIVRGALIVCFGIGTASAAPGDVEHEVVFELDFTTPAGLEADNWLEQAGFELKRHAADPDRIEFQHRDESVHVLVKQPSFGLAVRPLSLPGADRLRLYWGVSEFPAGASYQHGVDNEAIMVYVFFGEERLPSGEFLIPDSPYFIGFYLCPVGVDEVEVPYVGHHYEKTGRYVCVGHPPEGETVVSEIHLDEEFLHSFGLETMPPVSGISIEVDTTDSDNDGHAAAFIERLQFLK